MCPVTHLYELFACLALVLVHLSVLSVQPLLQVCGIYHEFVGVVNGRFTRIPNGASEF